MLFNSPETTKGVVFPGLLFKVIAALGKRGGVAKRSLNAVSMNKPNVPNITLKEDLPLIIWLYPFPISAIVSDRLASVPSRIILRSGMIMFLFFPAVIVPISCTAINPTLSIVPLSRFPDSENTPIFTVGDFFKTIRLLTKFLYPLSFTVVLTGNEWSPFACSKSTSDGQKLLSIGGRSVAIFCCRELRICSELAGKIPHFFSCLLSNSAAFVACYFKEMCGQKLNRTIRLITIDSGAYLTLGFPQPNIHLVIWGIRKLGKQKFYFYAIYHGLTQFFNLEITNADQFVEIRCVF